MIYTFYSYKGGVGRTMALANVALWMYQQGLRVVMIDWDLEAPGLENFFYQTEKELEVSRTQLGLIDMLKEYQSVFGNLTISSLEKTVSPIQEKALAEDMLGELSSALPPIKFNLMSLRTASSPSSETQAELLLLTAGWRSGKQFSAYAENVQRFDWVDFYNRYQGELYFEWMRSQLFKDGFADVVLIDSRTGVTEMGGVCTRQLADVVVTFCAPNAQNLDGVANMARSFIREDLVKIRGHDIKTIMVPTRVDNSKTSMKNLFESEFTNKLDCFTPEAFQSLNTRFWDLRIPYISDYAYSERLAIGAEESDKDLEDAYKKLAAHLAILAPASSRMREAFQPEIERIFGKSMPTVFIYSADASGRDFGEKLRLSLNERGLTAWPDPAVPIDSEERYKRIAKILDDTHHLIIVLNGKTHTSGQFKKVLRYAKQNGICITPVIGPDYDAGAKDEIAALFRDNSPLDISADWEQLTRRLDEPCTALRVPFMVPELPTQYEVRIQLISETKEALLTSAQPGGDINLVALCGMGGFGKTTLATAVCHIPEVQSAYPDGILWVNGFVDPLTELSRVHTAFTGEALTFIDLEQATQSVAEKLADRRCLIVIDNVEEADKIAPFLRGGPNCTRLLTTRNLGIASVIGAKPIMVYGLSQDEAGQLLGRELDSSSPYELAVLASVVDNSPLALSLVNTYLRKRRASGLDIDSLTSSLSSELATKGPEALQEAINLIGSDAVNQACNYAVDRLDKKSREKLLALVLNSGHAGVSLQQIAGIWKTDADETSRILDKLIDFSLIRFFRHSNSIVIPNMVRSYINYHYAEQLDPGGFFDMVYNNLSEPDQAVAKRLFLRMVRVVGIGEARTDTQTNVLVGELDARELTVMQELLDRRILRLRDEHGKSWIEFSHDSVLEAWGQLRHWVNANRDFLLWRQRLRAYLDEWQDNNQNKSMLLKSDALWVAQKWMKRRPDDLNEAQRIFIERSIAVKHRRDLLVRSIAAIVGISIAMAVYTVYTFQENTLRSQIEGAKNLVAQTELMIKENDARLKAIAKEISQLKEEKASIAKQQLSPSEIKVQQTEVQTRVNNLEVEQKKRSKDAAILDDQLKARLSLLETITSGKK